MTAPRLLLLVSPELHGPDVAAVQQQLASHGFDVGRIDGVYAATTAAAVRRFQREHGLQVDGIVGPNTRKALEQKEPPKPPAPLPGREPPGQLALAWLEQRIGMKEHPPDTNECPITAEFGLGPVPWCAEAVSLAFKHGAGLILGDGPGLPPWGFWPGRGFAYCPALEAWLKVRGYWIGRVSHPQPGDVALYGWGGTLAKHVGIVANALPQLRDGGGFDTVEGNTAVGNDSNGGEVMRRERTLSEVVGFGRVRWQAP